jgi:copper homeostasis protein
MKGITVEVCCGSVDDVIQAKEAGAARVELNSCLFLGGLTPSIGEVRTAKKVDIEIMAMVRPRGGGFCYTGSEFETMLADTEALINEGVDGIVFGILKQDGNLDEKRCAQIMKIIGNKKSVFHRAIDVVPDWRIVLDALIDLGVTRILTSGQHPSVHYGMVW